jgi:hypothetical protein
VYTLLTRRRAVDYCRVDSSLCPATLTRRFRAF